MNITIDYLKSKGFDCSSIREQSKGDFKITLNRYGEFHHPFFEKEANGITDVELKTQRDLENLYYAIKGKELTKQAER
jgi:predicted neutral ceramidase superfamily lipid hydrolase